MAIIRKEERNVPFEKAMSMTGYGIFNILLLLATGGCLMCVIIETMCMMFIIPAAQCDLDLSLTEKGLLSSVSFFGVVFSSYPWGYIADTRGRKNVLILSLGISSVTTVICSVIPWDWLFILLRFINGFFIGGASSAVYAYAGEFHDNNYRPKVISWMSTFVAFGNMYLPGLAWLILPEEWRIDIPFLAMDFRPWRLLLIIYALPSIICAICLYCLPESPKYLLTQGRSTETLDILRMMFVMNTRKDESCFEVDSIICEEFIEEDKELKKEKGLLSSMWKQTVPLFKGQLLTKTLMMCFLQFGIFASNAGIVMWYPEILNRMSHYIAEKGHSDVTLCTAVLSEDDLDETLPFKACRDNVKTQVFLISLMIGVAYAFVYLFIGCVINILGKKKLMISFIFITTITGMLSQFVEGYNLIQFLIGIFLMGGAGIGITNAIAVDLFPTQVRAMALAVSLMFGRVGAMAGTNLMGPLIYNFCDYLFYIVAADHLLLIIVVILLPSASELPKLVQ